MVNSKNALFFSFCLPSSFCNAGVYPSAWESGSVFQYTIIVDIAEEPYYWADLELYELRSVHVMPEFYYRWLFHFFMWLVEYSNFRRLAERRIHTIPYYVRFHVA